MSIVNGRIPIKITSAQFVTADQIAVMGFVLTNSGAAAVGQATIQDGHNNDICALNTTATNGVAQEFYPTPITMSGLSVPSLSGSGAILCRQFFVNSRLGLHFLCHPEFFRNAILIIFQRRFYGQ